MSRDNQAECRARLLSETPNAIEVQELNAAWTFWFPRSQIGYMRKDTEADGRVLVTFTCPEWLIEKKNAWVIVP